MADTFLDLSCNLILFLTTLFLGFPVGPSGKESACQWRSRRRHWVKKILWGRDWQLPPVLLPGKSHGWRGLADYSPWALKGGHNWARMHTATLSSSFLSFPTGQTWTRVWISPCTLLLPPLSCKLNDFFWLLRTWTNTIAKLLKFKALNSGNPASEVLLHILIPLPAEWCLWAANGKLHN